DDLPVPRLPHSRALLAPWPARNFSVLATRAAFWASMPSRSPRRTGSTRRTGRNLPARGRHTAAVFKFQSMAMNRLQEWMTEGAKRRRTRLFLHKGVHSNDRSRQEWRPWQAAERRAAASTTTAVAREP